MEETRDWHSINAIRVLEENERPVDLNDPNDRGRNERWNRAKQYNRGRDGEKRVPGENVLPAGSNSHSNNGEFRGWSATGEVGARRERVWLGADSITGCLIRLSVDLSSVCIKLDFHRYTLTHSTSLHCNASKLRCSHPIGRVGKGMEEKEEGRGGSCTMIAGSNFISTWYNCTSAD